MFKFLSKKKIFVVYINSLYIIFLSQPDVTNCKLTVTNCVRNNFITYIIIYHFVTVTVYRITVVLKKQ